MLRHGFGMLKVDTKTIQKMSTEYDVAIIGAGISGLCSAKILQEKYGLNVVVLEARDRVGGRTLTVKDSSFGYCDLGGSYIGSTQIKVKQLVEDLSLELYKINDKGYDVHYFLGKRQLNKGTVPLGSSLLGILDVNNFWIHIDKMSKQVPLDKPWLAAKADEWDKLTVKEYIHKKCWTRYGRSAASGFVQGILTSEPHEVSLLFFLWYLHSGGGIIRNWEISDGGAQEFKIVGGSQQISNRLANRIGSDKVHLGSDVTHIYQQDSGSVLITCGYGVQYKAKKVISTVPPALLNRIRFNPPLPGLKLQAYQRMPVGSIIKTVTFYDKTFWRQKDLSGMFTCDCVPVEEAYDDTKPDGTHPAIMGFVLADSARDVCKLTKDERKKLVCEQYAEMYGCQEALQPVNYIEKNWMEDEYAGGCYVGVFPPGILTKYGKVLRERFENVHFAGTITASHWAGYMEGAVESAERVSLEVAHSLGKINEEEFKSLISQTTTPGFPFLQFSFTQKYLMPSVPGLLGLSVLGVGTIALIVVSIYHKKS
ncbi:Amine oxidase [flavin-containing] A [Exaiptasia diaphana]|nr:Amine oxidase [flavin-containing] A [Exaiptasia diaphana]